MEYMTPFEQYQHTQKKEKEMTEPKSRVLPWASEIINKMKVNAGYSPSPLLIWLNEETEKQRQGLKNEIDINEIKAAAKGVRNKWFDKVKQFPDIFNLVIDNREFEWQTIINL